MTKPYHESWDSIFQHEFDKPYMQSLLLYVEQERSHKVVFPPADLVFNAFRLTPLSQVKVVILGQDPYHGVGQAHGLSFSVPPGVTQPPSLRNIFKELEKEIESFQKPISGDLTSWAEQGVLLLNATLTVRAHQAGSHQNKGWEQFTDSIIRYVSSCTEHVVFMLWGRYAGMKSTLIDARKHLILQSAHPSPFSAHRGFLGNNHFTKADQYLRKHNRKPINWNLPAED